MPDSIVPLTARVTRNGSLHAPVGLMQSDGSPVQVKPSSTKHIRLQPSAATRLPSSQASEPSSMPLPHSLWQLDEQPSPLVVLPSSQVSVATSTSPLPQRIGAIGASGVSVLPPPHA